MNQENNRYIPAFRFQWLTPFYDFILKWVMREETFKRRLIALANFQNGQKVLDLGCGTGTLTVLIKQQFPGLDLTGLDGDPKVLQIAREKAFQSKLNIQWDQGMAFNLPYLSNSFDQVITSLMIHHLTTENKRKAFQEIFRVLKPSGDFFLLDFGSPHNLTMSIVSRYMSRMEEAADNMNGLLPSLIGSGGFQSIKELESFSTVFGPVSIYQSRKSGPFVSEPVL
jgi:ubiquinone/menaquinone biosynthesis C-methylase UbiE